MMKNTGEIHMNITRKKIANLNITPEAEKIIEEAVIEYIEKLTKKSLEYTYACDRKTLQENDVILALKFNKI